MAERKLICVLVTHDLKGKVRAYDKVDIPADINEVELKECLRDLGYISSSPREYSDTKVYLQDEDTTDIIKEICTAEYRSLDDLGIGENSLIAIEKVPDPKTEHYCDDPTSMPNDPTSMWWWWF